MSDLYTPVSTFHPQITIPADLEPADAESANLPLCELADNAKWLSDHLGLAGGVALLASPNTFTARNEFDVEGLFNAPQGFAGQIYSLLTDAATAILATAMTPANDSHSGNKWKKIFEFKTTGGQYVYAFSGASGATLGSFIVVNNAVWDTTAQVWSRRDSTLPTHALIWTYSKMRIAGLGSGTGTWTDWPDLGGNLSLGSLTGVNVTALTLTSTGNTVVQGNANVSGDVNAHNLHATSGDSNVVNSHVSGVVSLDGSSSEVVYGSARLRTTWIPLADVQVASAFAGEHASFYGGGGNLRLPQWDGTTGSPATLVWPVRLPVGAVMGNIEVMMDLQDLTIHAKLLVRSGGTWSGTVAAPTISDPPTASVSATTTGLQVLSVPSAGITIAAESEYVLMVYPEGGAALGSNFVDAIRIYNWQDPGPRNN